MFKKTSLIFPLLFSLSSCGNQNINPDIKTFFNNINFEKTYEYVNKGEISYSFIRKDEAGKTLASIDNKLIFNKSQNTSFYKVENIIYTGDSIVNNIETEENNVYQIDDTFYKKVIQNDVEISNKVLSKEDINDEFVSIFYTKSSVYKSGGYFYGEFLAAYLNTYSQYFSLSEDKKILTFNSFDDEESYKDIYLSQTISIDERGMLINLKQKALNKISKEVRTLNISASY